MTNPHLPIKTALISVSDKTNLTEFAQGLHQQGVRILSTGGTAKTLKEAGIPVTMVSEITDFPEIMEGRVKTLHPKIHGGILGKRDAHEAEATAHDIGWIDMVVVNLYPFEATVAGGADRTTVIENIDIGGPAMIRAAAKNHEWVTVVQDPADYEMVLAEIKAGGITMPTRERLAGKAFAHTAYYDARIAAYLQGAENLLEQEKPALPLKRLEKLRYGENPHQEAALFESSFGYGLAQAKVLQGKALSYNNLMDAEAALQCVREFADPAAVVVKHANPCGVAVDTTIEGAYAKAFAADSQSAFGGIIALNRPCTAAIAEQVASVFMEVILAPSFDEAALSILAKKKNLRVIAIPEWEQVSSPFAFRAISGGLLVQGTDRHVLEQSALQVVTAKHPTATQLEELQFAWQVAKHLKSNAIAISKNQKSVGLSGGQVSRIAALNQALKRAEGELDGAVLASDAFFPFRDSIDALKGTGVAAIIQPGGSVRDQEVIDACDEVGIAMVFTSVRCFNH